MPWLTIALTLLTYFLSPRGTAAERRNALLGAAAVGVGTYAVSHYTDWGQENLGQFDGVVDSTSVPAPSGTTTAATTTPVAAASSGSTSGFWSTLKSWGAAGTAAVFGVTAGAVTGNNNLLIIGALAIGAIILLK